MNWSELNWEAIGGITQVVTIVYLVYQFHILPNKQRKEALFHIKVLFLLSRNKAQKLVDDLTFYCVESDSEYAEFMPNVTFKAQLFQLHHLLLNDLNDKAFDAVLKQASSDYLITTAVNSINKQIERFTELEAYFNTVFRFKTI